MMKPPFGRPSDVAYGNQLWAQMNRKGFNSLPAVLFYGPPPHGRVIEMLEGKINGKKIIVKRNYRGKGITLNSVRNDRSKYLTSITIMAKRGSGYDPKDQNWFWAKYKPDGTYFKIKKMIPAVGRVAKGMNKGCIACHRLAPAGDFVYIHNPKLIRYVR